MTTKAKPIPDGYHAITPYLTVNNGAALVEFLQKAFGATVVHRMDLPNCHPEARVRSVVARGI